jgi:hypothetical protein
MRGRFFHTSKPGDPAEMAIQSRSRPMATSVTDIPPTVTSILAK